MEEKTQPKFKIDIGTYGGISVEAPTKQDCLDMFEHVAKVKRNSALDTAIR